MLTIAQIFSLQNWQYCHLFRGNIADLRRWLVPISNIIGKKTPNITLVWDNDSWPFDLLQCVTIKRFEWSTISILNRLTVPVYFSYFFDFAFLQVILLIWLNKIWLNKIIWTLLFQKYTYNNMLILISHRTSFTMWLYDLV